MNDVVPMIETLVEGISLNLVSEKLHHLCQETNRPDPVALGNVVQKMNNTIFALTYHYLISIGIGRIGL